MSLRKMKDAPKDATELLARMTDQYGNKRWLVIHWAQGGGEEQPPFRGWFFWSGHDFSQISDKWLLGWVPLPEVES